MLKRINDKRPLAQIVAEEIVKLIEEKELLPGDKVPNELEMMESLNVGRGSIREAVKILVSRNILVIKRGVGTFVAENTGISDDPLGFSFIEDKQKLVQDSMAVRALLEPSIAAWAAINASDDDLLAIKTLCDETEQMILANEDYSAKDVEFHSMIAKSCKNVVVENLIPVLNANIRSLIDVTEAALKKESIDTHRKITNALMSRNKEEAYKAMSEHIEINQNRIKKIFG